MKSLLVRVLGTMIIGALSVGPVSAATAPSTSNVVSQAATNGTVSGTATDETGAPVVGATVTMTGPQTYTASTDAKGSFTLNDVAPGIYLVTVRKAGYDTANAPDTAIVGGSSTTLAINMHTATLTSLRTIASVSTRGRGAINTSTAAVTNVSAAVFADQGQPQVNRVLNEIPGVQISLPQTSGNAASPGAITFPNVRGGLSFETASLIDGHPVSVGQYGDYVTTFLSPYMLQGVDAIKGPGAMSPQVNYAIGGTINFRTKDPTATMTPDYTFGVDNFGGTFFNFGLSDTLGKIGFVVDLAGTNYSGNINGYQASWVPQNAVVTNPSNGLTGRLTYNDNPSGYIPGTASAMYNEFGLVGCCVPITATFNGMNELVKFRYAFSGATTATVSYFGSQTLSDQNANTGSITPGLFCPQNTGYSYNKATGVYTPGTCTPGGGYTGPLAAGSHVLINNLFPYYNREINNEPILQAEVRTTSGNDTLLGRFYHAGIQRLKREGGDNPTVPDVFPLTLNGVDANLGAFNNVTTPVKLYDYYNNPEMDSLNGLSFEWDHPVGDNDFSFAIDQTRSSTTTYSIQANTNFNGTFKNTSVSGGVPNGSSQLFTTLLERARLQLNPKLSGTISFYENRYQTTYLANCLNGAGTAVVGCQFDPTGAPATIAAAPGPPAVAGQQPLWNTVSTTHFDARMGLEYRPRTDLAVRFSMGSAIAPPYLNLFDNFTTAPGVPNVAGALYATQPLSNPNLVPETSFGYDIGADYRLKDGVTVISGDAYLTNLYNQFISNVLVPTTFTCGTSPIPCVTTGPNSAPVQPNFPVYYLQNLNLNNSRYEGLELSIKRNVPVGLGFSLSGAVTHAYPYNLPPCFYANNGACGYNVLLGVVPGINFTGGGSINNGASTTGVSFGGVSNQNIPYLTGNLQVSWTFPNKAFVEFGDTLYGKNNSLNEPPFAIAYASVRYPLSRSLSLQISGDNIFNAYSGLFPITGNGVPVPLAGLNTGIGGNFPTGTPAAGATNAGVLGPATYRFILTKNIGPEPAAPNQ